MSLSVVKGCLLMVLGASLAGTVRAQVVQSSTNKPVTVKGEVSKKPQPLRTELSGGFRLNTDGWSLFMDKGYVRSQETKYSDLFYNVRLIQVELSEHKSAKEIKHSYTDNNPNAGGEKSRPFIYGKVNNIYSLKAGYGFRKMIAGKPEPGTVSIHWTGIAGLALGMEKPYYLEAYVPIDNNNSALEQKSIKYTDETKGSFLNETYIIGSSGFSKGLNEIKFVPGIHAKTALHFDFAPGRKTVMAVEAGASAELYARKLLLMANQDAVPYFFNLFASFQFGRRW